jgi:hypothetical protein
MCFAALAAGCTAQVRGAPDGQPGRGGAVIPAEVVFFASQAYASGSMGAMSDRPIDVGAFQGWFVAGSMSTKDIEARPGVTYVVVTGVTGCRSSRRAELVRDGDDLYARFLGGEEEFEDWDAVGRAQQVGPMAQFAVSPDAVRGVRTIGRKQPIDPNGPGKLEEFIDLGPAPVGDGAKAAELGTAGAGELSQLLQRSGSANRDRAGAALGRTPPAGRRGFAFVLTGCAESAAVLIVNYSEIKARLTGDTGTRCVAAVNFLATFSIEAQRVPPEAKLG